jgi:hypothetical protein
MQLDISRVSVRGAKEVEELSLELCSTKPYCISFARFDGGRSSVRVCRAVAGLGHERQQ